MFALGSATFTCGIRSAREWSFEEASGETEVGRGHAPGMQTEPQLEAATSVGVILLETGQFPLLCSLQLWQQLQRCLQTRVQECKFFNAFYFCSMETVCHE